MKLKDAICIRNEKDLETLGDLYAHFTNESEGIFPSDAIRDELVELAEDVTKLCNHLEMSYEDVMEINLTDGKLKKWVMKSEAIERMRVLGIADLTIHEFETNNTINASDRLSKANYLCTSSDKVVLQYLEEKHKVLPYYCIKSNANIGYVLSVFYVCSNEDEWPYDRADMNEGLQCVYVHNFTDPDLSEFGTIGFKKSNGTLIRTA